MKRTTALLALVVVTASLLTGCDMVKAGARCRAGAPAGRDATHVLFCTNGRWKRALTIGQAANFILSTVPGKIESVTTGIPSAPAGEAISSPLAFKVTSRTGTPLAKAKVKISSTGTGAGLSASSPTTGETGADGVVQFLTATVTSVVGIFDVTAKVEGTDFVATAKVNVVPAAASKLTIVSGDHQTFTAGSNVPVPMAVKLTDSFGNPIGGKKILVEWAAGLQSGLAKSVITTDAGGVAATPAGTGPGLPVSTPATAGAFPVYFYAEREFSSVATTFNHTTVAGPPGIITLESLASPLSAVAGEAFGEPLAVKVTDFSHNPVSGATVTFTVVPAAGADAVLSAPTAVTGADGRAQVTATAGSTAGDYTITVTSGSASTYFSMRNT